MTEAMLHASELLTGEGVYKKGGRRVREQDLGRIEDGALVVEKSARMSRVLWTGTTKDLPKKFLKARRTNLKGERAIVPGLIDCHTHLVFAGDRSEEFARRCGGTTYAEIAAGGGGISTTVRATRAASEAELLRLAEERVREAQAWGVRTLEIKSGYGLDHASELKILRVVSRLKRKFKDLSFSPTYLGAHAIPEGVERAAYLREMCSRTLPEVARLGLADSVDVFIDAGYYTREEARVLLEAANKLGLKTRVHADELGCTHSAELAAELGALSADHLLAISAEGIAKLARSETVAVLLPGTAFYLKAAQAPARQLLDAGANVAIATDFNPGTSMTLSLPAVMTIAALYLGMSRAELFASVTYCAAKALGLEKRKGALIPGMDGDYTILPFKRFEELYYRFAWAPRP